MIYNIKQYIEKIYMPSIEFQFRVPKIDTASTSTGVEGKKEESLESGKKKFGKSELCLMDFSRPSDFRLTAVKAKKAGYSSWIMPIKIIL